MCRVCVSLSRKLVATTRSGALNAPSWKSQSQACTHTHWNSSGMVPLRAHYIYTSFATPSLSLSHTHVHTHTCTNARTHIHAQSLFSSSSLTFHSPNAQYAYPFCAYSLQSSLRRLMAHVLRKRSTSQYQFFLWNIFIVIASRRPFKSAIILIWSWDSSALNYPPRSFMWVLHSVGTRNVHILKFLAGLVHATSIKNDTVIANHAKCEQLSIAIICELKPVHVGVRFTCHFHENIEMQCDQEWVSERGRMRVGVRVSVFGTKDNISFVHAIAFKRISIFLRMPPLAIIDLST